MAILASAFITNIQLTDMGMFYEYTLTTQVTEGVGNLAIGPRTPGESVVTAMAAVAAAAQDYAETELEIEFGLLDGVQVYYPTRYATI